MDYKDILIDEERFDLLNQEVQADFNLDKEMREVLFSLGIKEIKEEVLPNNEHDKCAVCGEREAEVPIQDEEKNLTIWICEYCDSEMFDNSLESKGICCLNNRSSK